MSWYRSYLQESALYSTSPGSSPTLLPGLPSSPLASPDGRARVTAAGALKGRRHPQQEQQEQQEKLMLHATVQHVKTAAQPSKQQPRQQQQQMRQNEIRAAPAPCPPPQAAEADDPSIMTLTAALEAAWEGAAACTSTTAPTVAAASAGHEDSTQLPAGKPRSALQGAGAANCTASPARATAGDLPGAMPGRQRGSAAPGAVLQDRVQAAPHASTPGLKAGPAAKGAPAALMMQALPLSPHPAGALGATALTAPAAKTAGAGAAALPSAPTGAQEASASNRQDKTLPVSTAASDSAAPSRSSASSSTRANAIQQLDSLGALPLAAGRAAKTPSTAAGGEDPLGFDLCWEGHGLRAIRPSVVSPAAPATASGKATSSSSNDSSGSSTQTPQQQRQVHMRMGQVPVPAADDSWEALVSSMRQSHPDNGSRAAPAATASALGGSSLSNTFVPTAGHNTQQAVQGVSVSAGGPQLLPLPLGTLRPASSSSSTGASSSGSRGSFATKSHGTSSMRPLSPRPGPNLVQTPFSNSGGSSSSGTGPRSPRGRTASPLLLRSTSSGSSSGTLDGDNMGVSSPRANASTPLLGSSGGNGGMNSAFVAGMGSSPRASSPRSGSTWFQTGLLGASRGSASRDSDTAKGNAPAPMARDRTSKGDSSRGTENPPLAPLSPRAVAGAPSFSRLRSSGSNSSLQLAALGPAQASAAGGRSFVQSVRVRPPPGRPVGWWVCGGLAVAAVAGGAVAAVYGIMTYFLKMSMMYSLAWKAATGVAAAEGLVIGGWTSKNVRVQQAEAAKSAAELARMRKQAAQDLAALRALLQQQEASHTHEVSSLTALNERLTRLTQSLQSENSGLQGALDRAAADRKALEAAAALEVKRAETSALVGVTADATGRVAGEVEQLSRGQQQLVALVQELREDLMGLVAKQEGAQGEQGTQGQCMLGLEGAHSCGDGSGGAAKIGVRSGSGESQGLVKPGGVQHQGDDGTSSTNSDCSSLSMCSAPLDTPQEPKGCPTAEGAQGEAGSGAGAQDAAVGAGGVVRVSSVRGGVHAALAATVCGTLEL